MSRPTPPPADSAPRRPPAGEVDPRDAMIAVRDLRRTYGPVVALGGVSFSVPRGQVVGFLGPNGAGKTTTLKILTGTLAASGGAAWVGGCEVGRSLDFRARLGYLPENAPAYGELTVAEYLHFVARVRRLPRAGRAAAVDRVIDRCALGEMRHRAVGALSKGYRQRVGLAQAIVHDPDILILDEPTTGLDPNQVVHIRELVRALGRERTVLFSSHVLAEVQAVADRVLILDRGRLVADDTPQALGARVAGGGVRAVVRAPVSPAEDEGSGEVPMRLRRALAAVPALAQARLAPAPSEGAGAWEVRAVGDADLRGLLAATLVGAGLELLALSADLADLEAVFRALTAGGAPAAAPAEAP